MLDTIGYKTTHNTNVVLEEITNQKAENLTHANTKHTVKCP